MESLGAFEGREDDAVAVHSGMGDMYHLLDKVLADVGMHCVAVMSGVNGHAGNVSRDPATEKVLADTLTEMLDAIHDGV